jgi:hypothetical protein
MAEAEVFTLNRSNLRDGAVKTAAVPIAGAGEAVLRVSRFALTANNITYAVFGEAMRYWDFFPAEPGRGIAPVWGYADVVESRADGLAVGERVFGYLPFGSHLVVRPGSVSAASFSDTSAHRSGLSPFYNSYTRTQSEPGHDPEAGDLVCLLRPLFMTGFLLDDWLGENGLFGADLVVASSASSKTALAMAYGLKARGVSTLGLTSARNRAFVENTGLYSTVRTYEEIATALVAPAVYVDFAGDASVTGAVHARFGEALRFSSMVGGAHCDAGRAGPPPVGPQPQLFFAPDVMGARMKQWGPAGFYQRYGAAWAGFCAAVPAFMTVERVQGLAAAQALWTRLLDGEAAPDKGLIVEL